MAKLWAIIKREYLERVRSKWFLIATFFGPIFFAAIIIVPAWIASKSKATSDVYNTTILDATGTGFGHRLAVNIAGDTTIPGRMPTVKAVAPNELTQAESLATRQVMRKEKTGYVVVDQQTLAGESARYAGMNATSIADMAQIKGAIRQTILASRLEKVGLDNEKMKEITFIPLDFSSERITERGRAGSGMASVLFGFAIGFLLYLSIVIYGQTIMSGVLEEKTTRVAEVVMSSVPTDTLLAGKVLGVGAVGLTQQILWIATTYILLKLREPIMAKLGAPTMNFSLPDISLAAGVLFLLFFLLGFIFYSSLYAAVGSSVNSESVHSARAVESNRNDGARAVAHSDLVADHHADPHGGDGGAPARDDGEPGLPGDRLRRRPLAGIADLPRRAPYVREEAHHEGDGSLGFLCEVVVARLRIHRTEAGSSRLCSRLAGFGILVGSRGHLLSAADYTARRPPPPITIHQQPKEV